MELFFPSYIWFYFRIRRVVWLTWTENRLPLGVYLTFCSSPVPSFALVCPEGYGRGWKTLIRVDFWDSNCFIRQTVLFYGLIFALDSGAVRSQSVSEDKTSPLVQDWRYPKRKRDRRFVRDRNSSRLIEWGSENKVVGSDVEINLFSDLKSSRGLFSGGWYPIQTGQMSFVCDTRKYRIFLENYMSWIYLM